ncbi:MAG TPA: VOC family protein [Parachlamydiales bacterium]|nr:VOC family protein [Parachlamydiales bacterium]
MSVKEIGLIWIVVKDLHSAVEYYTEVVGLELMELNEEYGWAELEGREGGCRLGIAQENDLEKIKAGQNAVMTFSVDDLDTAKQKMIRQGARCVGDVIEVPGHVKMQTLEDLDGNCFQICEILHHSCSHC